MRIVRVEQPLALALAKDERTRRLWIVAWNDLAADEQIKIAIAFNVRESQRPDAGGVTRKRPPPSLFEGQYARSLRVALLVTGGPGKQHRFARSAFPTDY